MTIFALILRVVNLSLMLGIPTFLALLFYRRGKDGFRPIGVGMAAFLLSQAGHIPFNQFLLLPFLDSQGIQASSQVGIPLLILGIAVGLSAGIFEEVTRYLVFRFWLNKTPSSLLPLKYGVGHGGVESVLAGLLALYALVQVLVLGGNGALASFGAEQAAVIQSQITAYWAVPWQYSLLGAWERVSAMAFHLGASIMVYKSVRKRNPGWLFIAVLGHTLLDAYAVIAAHRLVLVVLESTLFVFAAGWLGWAWSIREPDLPDPEVDPPLPGKLNISAHRITSEQVEESRYDQ